MAQYRAVVGIDYPPNKRAEAGDIVSDLPEKSVAWLLDSGFIEPLDGKPVKKTTEPKPVETKAKSVEFKPNAKDGDKDGFVQDGTIHERPVESEDK
jgi:hypothetical protein